MTQNGHLLLNRYMANFQADSKNGLDLNDLQVPMKYADNEGRAKWLQAAPPRWGCLSVD